MNGGTTRKYQYWGLTADIFDLKNTVNQHLKKLAGLDIEFLFTIKAK